ncbi:MAG: ATP-dependent DNA helicase RecQ, partial [Spirochaetaceae bacterium]|nr:ATP-dependent DNA helicase RecQ [Spirochaetaceae bacterium]
MDIEKIINETAKNRFHINTLRPIQKKIITNILTNDNEKKANSLLVLLQTGGGKSLCFLLPSLLVEGITIIVYPLLALMGDQKKRLDLVHINSVIIEGGQSYSERKKRFKVIEDKKAKIIIINPEVLSNEGVMNQLRKFNISLFVIDEAHTICEWGLSFRPAYLNLGRQIQSLHVKQILAFTATANKQTLRALSKYLFFYTKYTIIRGGVDRKNIIYHKRFTLSKNREIANILQNPSCRPAIVFTRTRNNTRELYKNFNDYGFDIPTYYYHAGLSKLEKHRVEREFFNSNDAILFSTIAFGL